MQKNLLGAACWIRLSRMKSGTNCEATCRSLRYRSQSPGLPHTPAKLTIGPRLGSCALIVYLHGRGRAGTRLGTPHRCHWHTFQHNNRFHSSTICLLRFETVKENYFTPLFCHYTINHTNLCSLSDKAGSI